MTGYPTVLFISPKEKELGKLGSRDAHSVVEQLEKVFKEFAKDAANVNWADSVEKAMESAEDQLIFVFFYNEKRGSRLMKSITLENLKVMKALGKGFIAVKVELDRKSDLAKEYRVSSAPSMLIIDKDGNKVGFATGAKKPKEAIRFLEKAKKTHAKAKAKVSKGSAY
ncbi:MAG: DUF255 domain-containing protein [Planctomycetota bacterium]|nr:DUF255 domain-containing protein [Planctomycetota bacterium]